MKKKVLCWLLAISLSGAASLLRAEGGKQVRVVMKDGSIVKGELLGVDDSSVMLQSGGKAKDIPLEKVKKVFDSDGNSVPLSKAAEAAEEPAPRERVREEAPDESQEESRPSRRSRSRRSRAREPRSGGGGKGAVIAGVVLDVVGGVGFIGGLWMDVDGQNSMDNATSKYCPATVCTDGYYGYTIPGKKGYYTYTQYTNYYYGQTERDTGVVVMVVGGALLITGIIVGAVGSSHNREAGLIDVKNGKMALEIPHMDYNPITQQSRVRLLTAQF